jgi:glycosyltransferase involved in cell wall biosynthesis
MRALILHSGNLYGGIETALLALARASRRAELDLTVALCFDDRRFWRELQETGVAVHSLGAVRVSRPWQVRDARLRLRRHLEDSSVDVCVTPSTWTHALFAPVVRANQTPLVAWAHDRWTPARWIDRLALRHRPDLIVANSRYTEEGMRRIWPHVPIRMVCCPVEPTPPNADVRRTIRAQLGARHDEVVVVQVGRLDPYKGHQVLIEALARIPRDLAWRCWIVGGVDNDEQADYLAQLKSASAAHGIADRVTFTGARADIADVLAAADIFCHPNSRPEPFGLVFIEALRSGLPVVGSASGGVLEIVTDECGRLIEPGSVPALAATLTDLTRSPGLRAALGAAGPARASLLCDPDARTADFAGALARVARPESRTTLAPSVVRSC